MKRNRLLDSSFQFYSKWLFHKFDSICFGSSIDPIEVNSLFHVQLLTIKWNRPNFTQLSEIQLLDSERLPRELTGKTQHIPVPTCDVVPGPVFSALQWPTGPHAVSGVVTTGTHFQTVNFRTRFPHRRRQLARQSDLYTVPTSSG